MARNNVHKPPISNPPKSVMEWLNLFANYLKEIKGTENYYDAPDTTIKNLASISKEVKDEINPRYTSIEETKSFPVIMKNTIKSEMTEFSIRGKTVAPLYSTGIISKSVNNINTSVNVEFDSNVLNKNLFLPNKSYKLVLIRDSKNTRIVDPHSTLEVGVYMNGKYKFGPTFNLREDNETIIYTFQTIEDLENIKILLVSRNTSMNLNLYMGIYDSSYPDNLIKEKVGKGITSQNDIQVITREVGNDNNFSTRLISLPKPICGLNEEYYDILYYKNGKTYSKREVLHKILNGKENWKVISSSDKTILFGTDTYDDDIIENKKVNVISNNFLYDSNCNNIDSPAIFQDTESFKIRIRMYKSELPFQNEKGIKEWLKVNNTDIYVKTKNSIVISEPSIGKLNFDVFDNSTSITCEGKLITEITAKAPSNTGAMLLTILTTINKLINVSGDTITGDHKFLGCGTIYTNKANNPLMGTSIGKTYSLYSRITDSGTYLMEYKEEDSGELLASIEVGPDNFIINSEKGYISLKTKNNEFVFDGEKGLYTIKQISLGTPTNQFSEAYINNLVNYGARDERPTVPSGMIGYMYDLKIHKPIWWNGTNWTDGLGKIV